MAHDRHTKMISERGLGDDWCDADGDLVAFELAAVGRAMISCRPSPAVP